jgi:glutamyl-tRNA synthetase
MKELKVRFAPSPTGYLHVGGARTALFNWLYAKNKNGKFILRIEDTDFQRSSKEMSKEILDSMRWLGLNWDEGPFYQSDRLKIYQKYVEQLLKEGKAYRCFCSNEELEQRRKKAMEKGEKAWKYDRKCLSLTEKEIKEKIENKIPFIVRFKVPEGKTYFKDLIHKKIEVENNEIEDFVLLKSDKTPTYHLSVVADDFLMGVTTIIRGDDHLSNTTKQILLYKALNFPIPEFAHLPLIMGPDKQKLSKRHGGTAVLEYKRKGYLPLALLNFLAKLSWNPGEDKPFFSREELIERFNIKKTSKNNPVFDIKKLDFINSKIISSMESKEIFNIIKELIKGTKRYEYIINSDEKKVISAINLLKSRMRNLIEFIEVLENYLTDIKTYDSEGEEKYFNENSKKYLQKFLSEIKPMDENQFNIENLENKLRMLAEKIGVKAGDIIHPLRLSLTGHRVSPGIFDILVFFGKQGSVNRIEKAIQYMENGKNRS